MRLSCDGAHRIISDEQRRWEQESSEPLRDETEHGPSFRSEEPFRLMNDKTVPMQGHHDQRQGNLNREGDLKVSYHRTGRYCIQLTNVDRGYGVDVNPVETTN